MVNSGGFRRPKQKPTLPPELRGGKIGSGWFEDSLQDKLSKALAKSNDDQVIRESRITNKEDSNG